jgi:hypothetical protein
MSEALFRLANSLIQYTNGCNEGDSSSRCCRGSSKSGDVGSLDISRYLAEKPTDLQASIGKAISDAKQVSFEGI